MFELTFYVDAPVISDIVSNLLPKDTFSCHYQAESGYPVLVLKSIYIESFPEMHPSYRVGFVVVQKAELPEGDETVTITVLGCCLLGFQTHCRRHLV